MLITGIKSRPIYDTLRPLPRGRHHIVAAQGSGGLAAKRLMGELQQQLGETLLIYSSESFSGIDHTGALRAYPTSRSEFVDGNAIAIAKLREHLSRSTIGTALYLAGSETFIGSAMQVASEYNLKRDEVLREHCGTLARRVLCMHCNAINYDVTRRLFKCAGCEDILIVRDHYSQRYAAFMGIKADAETPGVLPPDEDLDT